MLRISLFSFFGMGPGLVRGIIIAIIVAILGYFWRRSKTPAKRLLKDSPIQNIVAALTGKVKNRFKEKLLQTPTDEIPSLVAKNPSLIEPQFEVDELDSRIVCNGLIVEPDIHGYDKDNQECLVFTTKHFDITQKTEWLNSMNHHVLPTNRVIIAAVSHSGKIQALEQRGAEFIHLQDKPLTLFFALLNKYYNERL